MAGGCLEILRYAQIRTPDPQNHRNTNPIPIKSMPPNASPAQIRVYIAGKTKCLKKKLPRIAASAG
jgi:hypothetical protein